MLVIDEPIRLGKAKWLEDNVGGTLELTSGCIAVVSESVKVLVDNNVIVKVHNKELRKNLVELGVNVIGRT